jgi:hypothetical protein
VRPVFAVIVLFLAGALAGCSDDGQPADFSAEAERLVPGAVLTLADLDGFSTFQGEDIRRQADLSAACDVFDPGVVFPGAAATADAGPFVGRADDQLLNYAAIYETEADAERAINDTRGLLDRCEDEFRERVEAVARGIVADFGVNPDLADFDVEIEEYDAPAAGDQHLGYRMHVVASIVITSQQYNLDVMLIRDGRVAGALMYGRIGAADEGTEEELAGLVADKLAATEEELSQE